MPCARFWLDDAVRILPAFCLAGITFCGAKV